jgi:hypothetical protein
MSDNLQLVVVLAFHRGYHRLSVFIDKLKFVGQGHALIEENLLVISGVFNKATN